MSGVSMCRVIWVEGSGRGLGLGGYQPGVCVTLKALFLVFFFFFFSFCTSINTLARYLFSLTWFIIWPHCS